MVYFYIKITVNNILESCNAVPWRNGYFAWKKNISSYLLAKPWSCCPPGPAPRGWSASGMPSPQYLCTRGGLIKLLNINTKVCYYSMCKKKVFKRFYNDVNNNVQICSCKNVNMLIEIWDPIFWSLLIKVFQIITTMYLLLRAVPYLNIEPPNIWTLTFLRMWQKLQKTKKLINSKTKHCSTCL